MSKRASLTFQAPLVSYSKGVHPGDIFVDTTGHAAYREEAYDRGASLVISPAAQIGQRPYYQCSSWHALAQPYRQWAAQQPAIAVTGTNGKTSVTQYLAQLLSAIHQPCPTLGTLGRDELDGQRYDMGLTTPDEWTTLSWLARWAASDNPPPWVAMELSSHALDQHRYPRANWQAAVITNISFDDHRDYHPSAKHYHDSKCRILSLPGLSVAWVHESVQLPKSCEQPQKLYRYGTSESCHARIDRQAKKLVTAWGTWDIPAALWAPFQQDNWCVALSVLLSLGAYSKDNTIGALPAADVPGRLTQPDPRWPIFVDFAHTPEALNQVLTVLKTKYPNQPLGAVFGCGGERDVDKRPKMGDVAEQVADYIILTQDNSRSEKPETIIQGIQSGMTGQTTCTVCLDREAAITQACQWAQENQAVLLVAGRGHEVNFQPHEGFQALSDIDLVRFILHHKS